MANRESPTTKQRYEQQFQESEVNFCCFGHFDQIGRGGEIKIPLGSEAHCHSHSGVESQLGFEFLLVNLPHLWARTKPRRCSSHSQGEGRQKCLGMSDFSEAVFPPELSATWKSFLLSWVATCEYFCHQEAKILGRNLNLEAFKVLPSLTGQQWSWGSETLSQLDEEQTTFPNVSR